MENIIKSIELFLESHRVSQVYFAQPGCPPPEQAYMVGFSRISVTLMGCDAMDMSQPNRSFPVLVQTGEATVIPPNCWNLPDWTKRATVLNLLVGQKQLGLSLINSEGNGVVPTSGYKAGVASSINGVERLLVQALMESGLRKDATAAPVILDALLHSLLDALRQPKRTTARKSEAIYESIALYLQQNYAFPLSRESVAEHFHISAGHVSRLFRHEGLVGFNEYLNRVRVDRAKFLLRHHPLSLDEITAQCGYSDIAYFHRVFKRLTKITPSNYRAYPSR